MKKTICMLLAVLLTFGTLTGLCLPASAAGQSGDLTSTLTWSYEESSKTLTISGTGDIPRQRNNAPWKSLSGEVRSLVLGEGVTGIGAKSFTEMTALENLTLPSTLEVIGMDAFKGCAALKAVSFPAGLGRIDQGAFQGCRSLTTLTLPDTLTVLHPEVFRNCSSLRSVHLPAALRTIGVYAFSGCSSLTSVDIPNGVTEISEGAFIGCTSLKDVSLPRNLRSIGKKAFANTAMETLWIPASVSFLYTDPDGYTGFAAFEGCSKLRALYFLGDAPQGTIKCFSDCAASVTLYHTAESSGWENSPLTGKNWNGKQTVSAAVTKYSHTGLAECGKGSESWSCPATGDTWIRTGTGLEHTWTYTLVTAPHGGTPGAWKCSCSVCSVKNKTVSIPDTASAAGGAKTNNAGNQTYKTYGKTVNSYLVPCENGSFLRVEALQNAVAVESYDETGSFLWHRDLPMELPLFGGFYAGEDYFFLVFGQYNLRERDDVEVLRVVRYTKDLMRCGEVSVYGANTQIPFSSGSLRMLQQSDTLYIHTCHTMYQNSDGYIDDTNHQANMVLSVNVPSMTLNECFSRISGTHYGYVSHSFNQFIVSDGAYIYTLNQCDSDPRGALISRYHAKAGEGMFHLPVYSSMPYVNAFPFARQDGANYNITGATLGGMTICGENILAAGTSSREAAVSANDQQNVFVTVTDKTVFNKPYEEISDNGCLLGNHTRTVWLTAFASDAGVSVSTPQMTKLSDSRVLVLWNENGTLCWTILDELGSRVTEIFRDEDAGLSDCAPVCKGSTVEWYVTEGGAPVFYLLDANHPENLIKLPQTSEPVQQIRFTDVPEGAWFYDAVLWAVEKGITSGTSETTFSPFEACTRAQAVTFLWRAAGSPAPKGTTCPFTDVKPGAYYYKAVLWAVENGITSGVAADTFGSDLPCTREQIVTFLWKAAGGPAPSVSACPFADVIPGAYYYDAVLWAYGNGITSGMAADTFGTGSACNRAAIVLFLRCACG